MERNSSLNRMPLTTLKSILKPYTHNALWIEDGRITGVVKETTENCIKKSPHRPLIQVGIE